jgi:hypothetical protein
LWCGETDLANGAARMASVGLEKPCFAVIQPQKTVQNSQQNWLKNSLSAINLQVILEEIVIHFD